ncbi:MAG: dTMP kinase [Firmicutes bacterium]|nr:dTMP kinase [Bacillota bacterium]
MSSTTIKKGKLITIEGCEGVGKTTQVTYLKGYCKHYEIPAVFTREPGGVPLAEKLREVVLDPAHKMCALTELLLYSAARAEHINTVIKPALDEGKLVVCDRFIYSTMAYQGYGRGVDVDFIKKLNSMVLMGVEIDLTVFIDLSPEQGFVQKGGAKKDDRIEQAGMEFHRRVYQGFKEIACTEKKIVAIDGTKYHRTVFDNVISALKKHEIIPK